MEQRNTALKYLVFVIIGILLGFLITMALLSYTTGVSVETILSKGGLTESLANKVSVEKTVKIESNNFLEPVSAVAEKVQDSVVSIRVEKLERYYDFMFGPYLEKIQGIGTGIIIRKDGYILTNNHVVAGADTIIVTMRGGNEYRGRVIGRDPETDLAVVKIDADNLPAAEIGDSSKLRVGELAVAVGNPFGFNYTVSAGVISALRRNVQATDDSGRSVLYTNLIQTDAAINPGNSGGPLCNSRGEVIGVNSLIYSRSGGYEGIGFAIPINDAMEIARQLIETGKASHPYLGIYGDDAANYADRLPENARRGAVVVQVIPGTPAERAGLRQGDVIVAVDGESITSMEDLIATLRKKHVGDEVTLKIIRDGKEIEVKARLSEKPVSLVPVLNSRSLAA